jgi:hypothetical protein
MLETQSLRPHALYLFIERVDLVVEQCVLRLFCIAGTQFIERLLNGEFVDLSQDCCLPRRRKIGRLRMDNRGKSFRLDDSLLAAPDKAASPASRRIGGGGQAAS